MVKKAGRGAEGGFLKKNNKKKNRDSRLRGNQTDHEKKVDWWGLLFRFFQSTLGRKHRIAHKT